jgi:hypothetical protein
MLTEHLLTEHMLSMVALMSHDTVTSSATARRWYHRAAATGQWVRDSGLGIGGVALLILVAGAGWGGSTIGLHAFAATRMGYSGWSAWLVPATFDGASVGLTIAAFRAAINGRGALFTRLGIVAFTGLSAWMNYERILDPAGRHIAALLPVSGVALLESLLAEARKAYERRHGATTRPRLHPLRVVFDWRGTWRLWRDAVLAIPLRGAAPDTTAPPEHVDVAPASPQVAARVATVSVLQDHSPSKRDTMRAAFDRAVAEGRADQLTGADLARVANANPSLGRRYLSEWREELVAAGGVG